MPTRAVPAPSDTPGRASLRPAGTHAAPDPVTAPQRFGAYRGRRTREMAVSQRQRQPPLSLTSRSAICATCSVVGGSSYRFAPHVADLTFVQGSLTTTRGPINAGWRIDKQTGTYNAWLDAPSGTTGEAGVPTLGATASRRGRASSSRARHPRRTGKGTRWSRQNFHGDASEGKRRTCGLPHRDKPAVRHRDGNTEKGLRVLLHGARLRRACS